MSDEFNQPPPSPPASTPPSSSGAMPPPPSAQPQAQAGYTPPPASFGSGPVPVPAFGGYPYAAAYPFAGGAPARKARAAWFWPVVILGLVAVLGLSLWAIVWAVMRSTDDAAAPAFAGKRIAVIDLDGVIVDADKVDTQLRKFGDDDSVKAIILHINSPGGGAAASQEIYHEVLSVRREKHKPVIASVESVGASGAYYIASACDKIYANDASVVGSIGVIMEWTNYGDLMRWAKMKSVVIHAGELKDAGDPTRDMTPKEAAYFQSLVDNMYGQFIGDVASGRHTTAARIAPLATGQVWTGQQSLPLGLIDKVGGFRVALMDTANQVGIHDEEPTLVRPNSQKKGLVGLLNGDSDDLFLPNPAKLLDHSPGFYFLWK